jgi:hypothetical protein
MPVIKRRSASLEAARRIAGHHYAVEVPGHALKIGTRGLTSGPCWRMEVR